MSVQHNLGKIVICDLDGTIADLSHRLHHIKEEPKNWDLFFSECVDDAIHHDVIDLLWAVFPFGTQIYYFSGRSDVVKRETQYWLAKSGAPLGKLRMRKQGDHRPDHEVKAEMLQGIKPADVWFILDDRDQVVSMWRSKGFRVLQVANGDF
jgi:hypothetical protein